MAIDLRDLVAPIQLDTFLNEYWTRKFLHVTGPPDKFAAVYSWDALNRTLEEHRFDQRRLRMVKAGQTVDASRYLNMVTGQVNSKALRHSFVNGATLILNYCDETHAPVRDLCICLERVFHVDIHVNLYAATGTDHGFDVHWDESDTFILQIAGCKQWKAWTPTRDHPFREDVVDTSQNTRPSGPPLWEGVLLQGEMLHIPRGWWHVACATGAPSLHLTVTVKSLSGIDFLRWLANQMKADAVARMPLPLMQNEVEKQQWLQELWNALERAWRNDLIARYVADRDRQARVRPLVGLPDGSVASQSRIVC